jgi:hypothetical protein
MKLYDIPNNLKVMAFSVFGCESQAHILYLLPKLRFIYLFTPRFSSSFAWGEQKRVFSEGFAKKCLCHISVCVQNMPRIH